MGTTTKRIAFWDPAIEIDAHTATHARDIRRQSLRQFLGRRRGRLEETDRGDLICTREDGAFIQGPCVLIPIDI
jgi:hypothetical protein